MATAANPVLRTPPQVVPIAVLPASPPQQHKHPWIKWATATGALTVIVVAWQLWQTKAKAAMTHDPASLERGTVQSSVTATGAVNAVVGVLVGSQVSDYVRAIYADLKTKVTKGQWIALMDPAVFQSQVDQARVSLRIKEGCELP